MIANERDNRQQASDTTWTQEELDRLSEWVRCIVEIVMQMLLFATAAAIWWW